MYMELASRGPVTAIGCLVATATAAAGQFMLSLYQTTTDCAQNAKFPAACGIDIFETVLAGLIAVGSAVGATAVGFTSPTPRDVSNLKLPAFSVDGVGINWHDGMTNHGVFGLNRTFDNPAQIDWQHNVTAPFLTYYTYTNEDNDLVFRHDTGIDLPIGNGRRSQCRSYIDVTVNSDSLRSSEYQAQPTYNDILSLSSAIIHYYVNQRWNAACIFMGTIDGVAGAKFRMGASCSQSMPSPMDCTNANYDTPLFNLPT